MDDASSTGGDSSTIGFGDAPPSDLVGGTDTSISLPSGDSGVGHAGTGSEDQTLGTVTADDGEETVDGRGKRGQGNPSQDDGNPGGHGNSNPGEHGNSNPGEHGNSNPGEHGNSNPGEHGNSNPGEARQQQPRRTRQQQHCRAGRGWYPQQARWSSQHECR